MTADLRRLDGRATTAPSDLILNELPRLAHRPSPAQLLERIRHRAPVAGPPAADLIKDSRR
jgi:hypothetical protein